MPGRNYKTRRLTFMLTRRVAANRNRRKLVEATCALAFGTIACVPMVHAVSREYLSGIQWQEPAVVTPGENGGPPSDAIVLFDGKDLSAWEGGDYWKIENGVAIADHATISTKQKFGDCQLHVEWTAPDPPRGEGQDRGNSGVFLQDRYEMQVLDSYVNKTYFDGQAAAIYKQTPPLVNAMRPPGQWNIYDIVWTAPKFKDDGSLESPAYITALHNNVLVLNHYQLLGDTPWSSPPKYEAHGAAPISLQYHNHPVRYRNLWVRDVKPIEGMRAEEPYFLDHDTDCKWPTRDGDSPPQNSSSKTDRFRGSPRAM
jgi:hypothetical protein